MPQPHVPAELRHRPFTGAQADAAGLSVAARRSSEWRHLFRDVWVHRDVEDTKAMRVAAVALVLGENTFVCGHTAAWIHGIEVDDPAKDLVWIGCRPDGRIRRRAGCHVMQVDVAPEDLEVVGGITVTTAVRTAFDCARMLALPEGVVVADALLRSGRVTREVLRSYAGVHRGLRGIRRCDQVLGLMDGRSESPMESRLRVLLIEAGLPRPQPQLPVEDGHEHFVARVDLGYHQAKVAVEYDGAWHWKHRRADDRRRDELRDLGWEVIVVSAEDYYRTPQDVVARVRRALIKRGTLRR